MTELVFRVTKNKKKIGGFTLQQWAFLLATLTFIFTAVITFSMMLGLRHTRDAWELVLNDLNEEEMQNANSVYLSEQQQYKSNKRLLHRSQHVVQVLVFLLDIGTIFGCVNQVACGALLYGISTRSAGCILPWLLISGLTYFIVSVLFFVGYFGLLPGLTIDIGALIIGLMISTLFILVWYIMFLYYSSLFRSKTQKITATISPTIMEAYGGYIHQVDDTPIEKKIIV